MCVPVCFTVCVTVLVPTKGWGGGYPGGCKPEDTTTSLYSLLLISVAACCLYAGTISKTLFQHPLLLFVWAVPGLKTVLHRECHHYLNVLL